MLGVGTVVALCPELLLRTMVMGMAVDSGTGSVSGSGGSGGGSVRGPGIDVLMDAATSVGDSSTIIGSRAWIWVF